MRGIGNIKAVVVYLARYFRRPMVLCLLLAGLCLSGCDRGSDNVRREPEKEENGGRDDDKPTPPGEENRPGPSDKDYDFTSELPDACVRYKGSGLTLRFDRGGVLAKVHADGRRELIDLDGGERVEFTPADIQPDSLIPEARLAVNGSAVRLKSVRMKKQTAEAVWYHAVDEDDKNHILVLP
ncbi:hypothetical protein [uncultured Duncaniella sp.]|uniref:hypothetical protein n=1 Tax=uncultured Duncaniella sp. TaxID=2768039 RepID=UPI0025E53FAF|nr:hypothetical protein [uncultured Duncaniella sp.]